MSAPISNDPTWAVQKAIFAALDGHIMWGSITVPVFDVVPQDTAFPYISLDSQMVNEADQLARRKDERLFYLSVWSIYEGQKQVSEIMSEMDALLHWKRLPLDTGRMVRLYVKRKMTTRDIDRSTFQGLMTLRIITTH